MYSINRIKMCDFRCCSLSGFVFLLSSSHSLLYSSPRNVSSHPAPVVSIRIRPHRQFSLQRFSRAVFYCLIKVSHENAITFSLACILFSQSANFLCTNSHDTHTHTHSHRAPVPSLPCLGSVRLAVCVRSLCEAKMPAKSMPSMLDRRMASIQHSRAFREGMRARCLRTVKAHAFPLFVFLCAAIIILCM